MSILRTLDFTQVGLSVKTQLQCREALHARALARLQKKAALSQCSCPARGLSRRWWFSHLIPFHWVMVRPTRSSMTKNRVAWRRHYQAWSGSAPWSSELV